VNLLLTPHIRDETNCARCVFAQACERALTLSSVGASHRNPVTFMANLPAIAKPMPESLPVITMTRELSAMLRSNRYRDV
jgi:hypothetical protein